VLTLALAVGANTAIFSVMNALLLKQLPYAQPDRMGTTYVHVTDEKGPSDDGRQRLTGEMWENLRDQVPSLISAVYLPDVGSTMQAGSHIQYVHAGRVSAHYFDVLAIRPVMGRNFSEDEDRFHGPKAVILSYALWHNLFGDDPNAIGQSVLLKGEPHTVVGVLPKDATTPMAADAYATLQPSREAAEGAAGTNYYVITRLRDGANWQQADAELNRAWEGTVQMRDMLRFNPGEHYSFYSVPLQKSQTDSVRPQVIALMLAAGFILMIACGNLAGLTLVRMLRRTREIATRLALGASSWEIQKQVWLENVLLAFIGGVAGVAVGFAALRGMLLLLPEHFLPATHISLDARVLAFTFALSMSTSVLFGMLPALTTRKVDLRSAMASRSVIGGGSVRVRQALIGGEVALTIVLLAASGLLIRTLIHLETLAPGFNPNGVIVAKASLDNVRYHDPAAFRKLLNESIENMKRIPGVENAAYGLGVPYERSLLNGVDVTDGKEAGEHVMSQSILVTPGYFDTLQIPLRAGRLFTDSDGPNTQPVAIVNEALARILFHDSNAVGRYIDGKMLIVGVVANTVMSTAYHSGESSPLSHEQVFYVPAAQINDGGFLALAHGFFQPSWIVRTARPVEGLNAQMQRALAAADPNLPFSGFFAMNDLMAKTLAMQRVEVALLVAMASLALLLSAVGIFALVANLVAQRTREIGIRMALGSTIERAMLHVGQSGAIASAAGVVLGLAICAAALRAMRSVLWGVDVYDPKTLFVVVLTLGVVTMAATAIPARRVANIDPAITLRDE
jgi:predicted permease